MRRPHQIRSSALAVVALLTISFVVPAAPASAASEDKVTGQLEVVGASLASMLPGQSGWTALVLQAKNKDLCDLQVTTTVPGTLSVVYPSSRTFTAPYRDAELSKDEIDYIAFRFSVPESTTTALSVPLTFKWVDCKNDHESSKTYDAVLPVTKNTGPAFIQKTNSVGPIPAGSAAWVDVSYTGMSPNLTNFAVKVTDAAGATVGYPAEASSSKLAEESTLGVLSTDSAALRIDTTGMKAGTYTLRTTASYGSPVTTVDGSLTLTVS